MTERIYLDFNASTPVASEVAEALQHAVKRGFGNPSNPHWAGLESKRIIDSARRDVAELIGAFDDEIVFTSGGTEAANTALKGLFFRHGKPFHVITSRIEHPATLAVCQFLERQGAEVTRIGVHSDGTVDVTEAQKAIRPDTRVLAFMHANNETGVIQPIRKLADLAHAHDALLYVDAAQSVGKIPVDVADLGADFLAIAGHKFYAPKGIGALFVRRSLSFEPHQHGAGHESGRRAGTESTPMMAALGEACRLARRWLPNLAGQAQLRDRLWNRLQSIFGSGVQLFGVNAERLPNTLFVGFVNRIGSEILARIPEIAASTGSACHAGQARQSPVLEAMQIPENVGLGAVRFSLGRETTLEELDRVGDLLEERIGRS
jgi:cysteine desulfurase